MIDFPAAPAVGQVHNIGTVSWSWDGTKWTAVTAGSEAAGISIEVDTGMTLPIGASGAVMADTSAASMTILLPALPSISQEVLIKDATGNAGMHPITVGGNGQLIEGAPTVTIATNYGWLRLIYSGSEWVQS